MNMIGLNKFVFAAAFALLMIFLPGCGTEKVDHLLVSAEREAARGKWEKAHDLAAKAVKLAPSDSRARLMLALTAERIGDRALALDAARGAVELAPQEFLSNYVVGRLLASDPAPERRLQSSEFLRKALIVRPDSTNTLVLLCNALSGTDGVGEYVYKLSRMPDYENNPALLTHQAVASIRAGQRRNVTRLLIRAYRSGRGEPRFLYNLACYTDRYSKSASAVDLYEKFLKETDRTGAMPLERKIAGERVRSLQRKTRR
ncbi:MAG: hypothetical protein PHS41_07440 [Victivallaceae bacterium]|nr:hypothetical protein [Victivallaceae bacterium]